MKELNILFLASGILMLVLAHLEWWTRHDAVVLLTARYIVTIVAGWALTTMGYLGLLLMALLRRREVRGFPVQPLPSRGADMGGQLWATPELAVKGISP
jgi:hypothetical protein